jgi:hypothetical protein
MQLFPQWLEDDDAACFIDGEACVHSGTIPWVAQQLIPIYLNFLVDRESCRSPLLRRSQQIDLERIADKQSEHMPPPLLSIFRFVRPLLNGHQPSPSKMLPCGCNSQPCSENVSDPF